VTDETPQERVGEPERWHGIPHDTRRPTVARNQARYWNPDEPRFFTPKVFGAGWTVNAYWVIHPVRYVRNRGRGRPG
jgi:hypothetical protein